MRNLEMHKLSKRIVIALSRKRVLLPILILSLLLIGFALYWFARQNKLLEIDYTSQFKLAQKEQYFQDLFQYVQLVESNVRGYAATGNNDFVENFEKNIDSIRVNYSELVSFEKKNKIPIDSSLVSTFDKLLWEKISFTQQLKDLCDQGNRNKALELISSKHGVVLSNSIVDINEAKNRAIRDSLQLASAIFVKASKQKNKIAYSGIFVSLLLITGIIILLLKEIKRSKQLTEENRKQKEHFRTTLNSLGEAVISTDKAGKIQYMNPVAELLSGWNWKDAKKQQLNKVFNVLNEETGKPIENIVSRILKDGKKIQWENNTILKAKDKGTYIISNNGTPLLDENKNISGVVLVFNDITEKNKTEKALKESESKYRNLIEQASDAILIFSYDGTIHEFNNSACYLSGYSKEEFSKLQLRDILVGDIISSQEKYNEILAGKTVTLNRQFKRKDDLLIDMEITIKMLEDKRMLAFGRDITERKKAERALEESENRLRTIVNAEPECVKLLNQQGEVEDMNPAGLSMIEADNLKQVKGKSILGLIKKPYRESFDTLTKKVFNGKSGTLEFEITGLKDTSRWIETHAVPMKNASGKIISLLGVSRDISERRKAEEELRSSEEAIKLIMNSSLDAIISMNREGIITTWSLQAEKIFGWKEGEVTGKTVSETIIPEKYRDRHQEGMQRYLRTGEGRVINKMMEITALNKEGVEFPVELFITTIKQSGSEYFCAFIKDITERKKAEQELVNSRQKFQSLVENISGVYWITDLEINKTLYVSPFYEKIRGSKPEELYNDQKDFINAIHPDDKEHFFSVYRNISETLKTNISYRIIKPSGEVRWIAAKSKVFIDNNGHKIEYGYAEDITENKKAEEEILEANKQLRLLSEHLQNVREDERTHMAREIHDELGQQLTIMKMDVSWLHEKLANSDEKIGQRTEELKSILDKTVTTVRRIASDLRPSILDDMGLGAAIEWHLAEFGKRSGMKTEFDNMETELELPDNVKTGLFRIVQESLTNVIRYANAKKVMISLKHKDGQIELLIKDNGSGFDDKKIAGKKTFGILGMKERTKMMGGKYEIKSTPGKGTTVTVSVPYPVITNE